LFGHDYLGWLVLGLVLIIAFGSAFVVIDNGSSFSIAIMVGSAVNWIAVGGALLLWRKTPAQKLPSVPEAHISENISSSIAQTAANRILQTRTIAENAAIL
jgi:hypothetical protein